MINAFAICYICIVAVSYKLKKKVLIVSYSMGIGGVEKALMGLLHHFDYSRYDVELRLVRNFGEFLQDIPKEVKVSELTGYNRNWRLLNDPLLPCAVKTLKRGNIFNGLGLLTDWIKYKVFKTQHSLFDRCLKDAVDDTNYDMAISFGGPTSMLDYYVASHIKAKKKVGWIHFDVDKIKPEHKSESHCYRVFDKIFVVSKEGKIKFDNMFPKFADRSDVFHNIIDKKYVLNLAKTVEPLYDQQTLNLCTVGRLSFEKGQDTALQALALIKKKSNCKIKWTFVGDGGFRNELERLVNELDIAEMVEFIGSRINPYPYMLQADLYVQSSRHEGYCITLAEAKILNCSIVSVDFTGASEQLTNYSKGILCQNNPRALANAILKAKELLLNAEASNVDTIDANSIEDDFYKLKQLITE